MESISLALFNETTPSLTIFTRLFLKQRRLLNIWFGMDSVLLLLLLCCEYLHRWFSLGPQAVVKALHCCAEFRVENAFRDLRRGASLLTEIWCQRYGGSSEAGRGKAKDAKRVEEDGPPSALVGSGEARKKICRCIAMTT
jgi:hypothetical protein